MTLVVKVAIRVALTVDATVTVVVVVTTTIAVDAIAVAVTVVEHGLPGGLCAQQPQIAAKGRRALIDGRHHRSEFFNSSAAKTRTRRPHFLLYQ